MGSRDPGPGQQPLFDSSRVNLRQFEPVSALAQGAAAHAQSQGRRYDPESVANTTASGPVGHSVFRAQHQAVGEAHARSGVLTPELRESYASLTAGVNSQYEHMTRPKEHGGLGIKVDVTQEDPYPNVQAAADDVRTNNRLKVFSTASTGGHGLWSDDQNDRFRAVHYAYGHIGTGRDFSRHGEEAAFQAHAQSLPPSARLALASETRGQNAFLNWGGGGFPDNIPVQLPKWATTPSGKQPTPKAARAPMSHRGAPQPGLF